MNSKFAFRAFLALLLCFATYSCQGPGAMSDKWPGETYRLGHAGYAQVEDVPVEPLSGFQPLNPQATHLPGGLQLLVHPAKGVGIVEATLFVRAGSYEDPRGKTGLAEFVAEAIREGGSMSWPAKLLDSTLAQVGAELSVEAKRDRVVFRLMCLERDFESLFGALVSLLREPAFSEDAVERVRARMIAGVKHRDDDATRAATRESRRAFFDPGDIRTRRTEETGLLAMTIGELIEFHGSTFGSTGSVLAVRGFGDAVRLRSIVDEKLGDWEAQSRLPAEVPAEVPAPASRRVVLWPRSQVTQSELRLFHEGIRFDHPDWPALQVASYILGSGGFGSRMMRRIRAELGLAYWAQASWSPSYARQGMFVAATGTRHDAVGLALSEMLAVLETYLADGASEEEFASARNRLLNSAVFKVDQESEVLERFAELTFQGYPANFPEQVFDAIQRLTSLEVLDAAKRHLSPERLFVFVAGDEEVVAAELEEFGSVQLWDAEIPDQPKVSLLENTNQMRQEGAALAERVLASHGGRSAWLGVEKMAFKVVLPANADGFIPTYFETYALSQEGIRGLTFEHPDSEQVARAPRLLSSDFPSKTFFTQVIKALAHSEVAYSSPAEGRLELIWDDGERVMLEVEPSGLLRAAFSDSVRCEFDSFSLQQGRMLPGHIRLSGSKAIELEGATSSWEWQAN